jgi:MoxR-like ATPase
MTERAVSPNPAPRPASRPASPAALAEAVGRTGYLADEGLATVAWLAVALGRPLLLEGEPGTGKTALAEALAQALGAELIRLQCYEGIDASQALYDWDFPRQILHLRAVEATRRAVDADLGAGADLRGDQGADLAAIEHSLFDERFLLERPILRALRSPNAVLLVDEVDRADDEFEAFLLEVLSTNAVTVPELGTITAVNPPLVVLTSNRTREVHDALKRRCLYHWVEHPGLAREVEILRTRLPEVSQALAVQVATAVQRMRDGATGPAGADLLKPPGVAESLDWARCLLELGRHELDPETAAATLGAVCKYREDAERVRDSLDRLLAG